jgi:hypothetical protein
MMATKALMTAQETATQIIKRMADKKLKEAIVTRAMFVHISGRARLDESFWYAVGLALGGEGWVTGSVYDEDEKAWDLYVIDQELIWERAKRLHHRIQPPPRRGRASRDDQEDGGIRLR